MKKTLTLFLFFTSLSIYAQRIDQEVKSEANNDFLNYLCMISQKEQNNSLVETKMSNPVHVIRTGIYVSPDGLLYVKKTLPLYLKISTSPDNNKGNYLLKGTSKGDIAIPFYFDTEGFNTIRSPWAIDPSTKDYVYPKQDIVFKVYADGIPPLTSIKYKCKNEFIKNEKVFFGKSLLVNLESYDETSGVETILYKTNDVKDYTVYNEPFNFEKEGDYLLNYYAIDNVSNIETEKSMAFVVDLTSPSSSYMIHGPIINNILGLSSEIELVSIDELSGIKKQIT